MIKIRNILLDEYFKQKTKITCTDTQSTAVFLANSIENIWLELCESKQMNRTSSIDTFCVYLISPASMIKNIQMFVYLLLFFFSSFFLCRFLTKYQYLYPRKSKFERNILITYTPHNRFFNCSSKA